MSNRKKLDPLYEQHGINGYLIATTDEFLSEYPPAYARRLEFITNFSGSNGFAILQKYRGVFFTDGRYIEQAKKELDLEYFAILDVSDVGGGDWSRHLGSNAVIGYDAKIFSEVFLQKIKGVELKSIEENLIDSVWPHQPDRPSSRVWQYSEDYAGEPSSSKVQRVRAELRALGAKNLVLTHSESVCWLLNIRAKDLDFTPIALVRAVVTGSEIMLFIDKDRLDFTPTPSWLILPEASFADEVKNLSGKTVIDPTRATSSDVALVRKDLAVRVSDPCIAMKAVKNDAEIEHIQNGHIQDAIAVCEFFAFIDALEGEELRRLTEWDLGNMLSEYRRQRLGYYSDSFASICGFRESGAIIHYKAQKDTANRIDGDGLLLIDSGGQYLGATTDITRTISIGKPTEEQRKMYTLVLQGHLDLAASIFPRGQVSGSNIDSIARRPLWQQGYDYAHGTGHGVGAFLSVHEGPHGLSQAPSGVKLQKNMVLSNEPGFYKTGHFGIRIENLIYVTDSIHGGFLEFKDLTLVPYCKKLTNRDMLTEKQISQLDSYQKRIKKEILGELSPRAKKWLTD